MQREMLDGEKVGLLLSFEVMFGAMDFIYYLNRSIATKVDSTYLGY